MQILTKKHMVFLTVFSLDRILKTTFMYQQHLVCPLQGAVSWPYAIQASTPTYQLAGPAVSQPWTNIFCGYKAKSLCIITRVMTLFSCSEEKGIKRGRRPGPREGGQTHGNAFEHSFPWSYKKLDKSNAVLTRSIHHPRKKCTPSTWLLLFFYC